MSSLLTRKVPTLGAQFFNFDTEFNLLRYSWLTLIYYGDTSLRRAGGWLKFAFKSYRHQAGGHDYSLRYTSCETDARWPYNAGDRNVVDAYVR